MKKSGWRWGIPLPLLAWEGWWVRKHSVASSPSSTADPCASLEPARVAVVPFGLQPCLDRLCGLCHPESQRSSSLQLGTGPFCLCVFILWNCSLLYFTTPIINISLLFHKPNQKLEECAPRDPALPHSSLLHTTLQDFKTLIYDHNKSPLRSDCSVTLCSYFHSCVAGFFYFGFANGTAEDSGWKAASFNACSCSLSVSSSVQWFMDGAYCYSLRWQWKSGGNVASQANMCENHIAFCWGKYFEYVNLSFTAR